MAFSHCRSMDMNLVSITSKEENDRIIKQIRDEGDFYSKLLKFKKIFHHFRDLFTFFIGHEDKDFWTSGTKLGNDDDYQWLSIGKPVKFTDWGHGQPSNSSRENQNESCIHICRVTRGSRVALKWNDHLCSAKLYFICEQDLIEYEYCAS